jgi:uncharacterized OsmC-like protein
MVEAPPSHRPNPLSHSPHPLAFVTTPGTDATAGRSGYLAQVHGLGGFQKEGLVQDLRSRRTWRLTCDEGVYLGGTDMAPAPLMHWGAGLHADVTARVAAAAAARGVTITELHVKMIQGFGSQGSFVRGEALGLVDDLDWEVRIVSDADSDVVTALIDHALATSPAHAAMTGARESTFALYTNGRPTPVVGVPPSPGPVLADPFLQHSDAPAPAPGEEDTSGILVSSPTPTPPTSGLTDDMDGAVHWQVYTTGRWVPSSGLVETSVIFPGGSATVWTLTSDPDNRRAPAPLAYFAIGTAFCYHTQLCRYVKVRRLDVEHPRLAQHCEFATHDESAEASAYDTHLYINGRIDEAQTASLLTAAANTCYAHRGLAVPVTSRRVVDAIRV